MANSQEIIDILNKMMNLGTSIGGILDNKAKWENMMKMADYTNFLKGEATDKANAFKLQKENNASSLKLALSKLKTNYHKSLLWGATQDQIHTKVQEGFKSDEIQDVMKNYDLTLNDDLTVSANNVNNSMQMLKNSAKAEDMNRMVSSIIGGLNREFEGISDDMADAQIQNLGTGQGAIQNVIDAVDIEAYITQNPDIFRKKIDPAFEQGLGPVIEEGIPPPRETSKSLLSDYGEENIFANIVREPMKTKDGLTYGSWDKKAADDYKKALNTSLDNITKKIDTDWNADVEFGFNSISESEGMLEKDDEMIIAGGGRAVSLKGTKELYSNIDNTKRLAGNLESKILNILNFSSANENAFAKSAIGKKALESEGKSGKSKTTLMREIFKAAVSSEPNMEKYGYGNKIWASADMELIDLVPGGKKQQIQEDVLKKYIIMWGRLDARLNPDEYK